jgi:hypothetical protein
METTDVYRLLYRSRMAGRVGKGGSAKFKKKKKKERKKD